MEKRVLIISYYWPPTGGSGVQRWVKFAKYLPSEGWQPVIYTPLNPEAITVDESLLSEIPPQVEVIKRKIFEPYNIYRALTGAKNRTAQSGEVNPINAQKKSFTQKVSMWIRGNMFIPDPRCFWIGPSVRFLKKYLKEHPVDIIVSTGPPHSMHLIARKVARSTGIPWVADFRDPWTKMFYFKHLALSPWAERKHAKLEKLVLDDASVVVAVSPLVQDEFKAMTTTEVELITNGFDEDDFAVKPQRDEYFSITHTGLFASDGENLEDLGYCNHNDAVCLQKSSSLLILPLRKEPEYRATLPGKLFEYLASERPILGIGQTDGAMARIISQTQAGFVFDWNDEASISRYIDLCWERFRSGTLKADTREIGSFSRRNLTHRMACLFDRLTDRS